MYWQLTAIDSCILNNLLPGDIVLADRGFNIEESVAFYCAEVKVLAFTTGKKQLSPLEIEQTRKIAHLRIHAERVIGLIRNKFSILKGLLPIQYLKSDNTNQEYEKWGHLGEAWCNPMFQEKLVKLLTYYIKHLNQLPFFGPIEMTYRFQCQWF